VKRNNARKEVGYTEGKDDGTGPLKAAVVYMSRNGMQGVHHCEWVVLETNIREGTRTKQIKDEKPVLGDEQAQSANE
jgi:hypothetical protein